MSIALVLVLLKLRNHKKTVDLASVFIPEEHGISEDYVKKEAMQKFSSVDPMEFPRAKLHLMNTLLGEFSRGCGLRWCQ